MGWRHVADLDLEKIDNKFHGDECSLFARDGIEDVQIHFSNMRVRIPRHIMAELVAEEYRRAKVSHYEGATVEELLAEIGLQY